MGENRKTNTLILKEFEYDNLHISDLMDFKDQNQLAKQTYNIYERHLTQSC